MKFKKIISFLLVVVFSVGILASCASIDADDAALTYITLRINPEIELLANEDGDVVAANAINEDGEVVLAAVNLEGKSVEEAGAIFTETANDLGYFTPDGEKDTVYIDVESTIDGAETELEEKLDKSIRDYFNNNGINGKISQETLDKYADKASDWNISLGHTKLIMRVLDVCPELTDTEVLEYSVKDLMKLLKGDKGEEKITVNLKESYRESINALKDEYARVFELRSEIEDLEAQLEQELTEDEKIAIETQISEKESELAPLNDEYKSKVGEIKDQFRASSKEARKAYKAQVEEKQR